MSMAASIESRVPFLDHQLVEFAAGLPPRLKLRGFKTKWILREAVRELLPPEILARPKMGFPVPFGIWMRGPWNAVARDVLLDSRSRQRGIIDPAAVERLLDAHAAGDDQRRRRASGACSISSSGTARSSTARASRRFLKSTHAPAATAGPLRATA